MAETVTKIPQKTESKPTQTPSAPATWHPLASLRREIDQLFDDFGGGFFTPFRRSLFDVAPFWRQELKGDASPAVDITETDTAYEIAAELPGMDEKSVEVKLANGVLTIRGQKQEEKEEKQKDYYLKERSFGSFERAFQVPDGVDADKVEAKFTKGVLTVSLPKTAIAQKAAKKIDVKAA